MTLATFPLIKRHRDDDISRRFRDLIQHQTSKMIHVANSAQNFALFGLVIKLAIVVLCDTVTHIVQGCFSGTGAIACSMARVHLETLAVIQVKAWCQIDDM